MRIQKSDLFRIRHDGADLSFDGTWEECNEKFRQNQKTMPVVFHNVAQYQDVYVRSITIIL